MAEEDELRETIDSYFHKGYKNEVILHFLSEFHGINISLSTLKRRLQDYGLKRNNTCVREDELKAIISNELEGSGSSFGYRAMWHSLRLEHKLHVPRRLVARIMKELDPEGVEQRRRRRLCRRRYISYGPNFSWHVDGYDKLKPYGFPIHGGIDGYSRKILWLEVVRSNNKPEITAKLYLECVKETQGCPLLVRTDCGTENGIIASMQCYFRQHGNDAFAGDKAHRYGSSPANQRIESWWSFFRRGRAGWWIDFFKDMISSGTLDLGNDLQMECLWFCFEPIISFELKQVKLHWNTHRIRHSRIHGTVSGIPDVLYYLPQRSNGVECKYSITEQQIQEMEPNTQLPESDDEHITYQEYFKYAIINENIQFPCTPEEAFELFQKMVKLAQ